ncbi:hypothetical protein SAMN02745174_02430 [Cetobacterium ceti]|uniref:Phage terminase small subunit n=1 Tax=Cetobacterium ceti TaxID=180163 RepID=A0A1T4QT21_9FUSO|nr:hypothetical protein [Cetobacterium ceti]SKA06641.1 hypothetical protein SAMN02745174_02430 [Cetobacterium ceti]
MKKAIWEKIRLDYELEGMSLKSLSEKYNIHRNSISAKKKAEGWQKGKVKKEIALQVQEEVATKFSKSVDEIFLELDDIHDLAQFGIKLRLSEKLKKKTVRIDDEVFKLPAESLENIEKAVKALALIRSERVSMRNTLIYDELVKNNLEIAKLKENIAARKAKMKLERDKLALEIKRAFPEEGGEEEQVVIVDDINYETVSEKEKENIEIEKTEEVKIR